MRWIKFSAPMMMLLLTACNAEISDDIVVKAICPTIVKYDKETQDRALLEYRALPSGSAIRLFIGDYKRLRDQVNACRLRAGQ
ncbi:hypothetical protein [Bradyrhizobium sp. S3.7.6]